ESNHGSTPIAKQSGAWGLASPSWAGEAAIRATGEYHARIADLSFTANLAGKWFGSASDGLVPLLNPGRAIGFDHGRIKADQAGHAFFAIGNVRSHFIAEFGLGIGWRIPQGFGKALLGLCRN